VETGGSLTAEQSRPLTDQSRSRGRK